MKFPLFTRDVFSIVINVRTGQDHLMLPCFLHANVTFPSSFFLSYMLMQTNVYKSFKSFPSWLYIEFLTLYTYPRLVYFVFYWNGNYIKVVTHRIMIYDMAYPQFRVWDEILSSFYCSSSTAQPLVSHLFIVLGVGYFWQADDILVLSVKLKDWGQNFKPLGLFIVI